MRYEILESNLDNFKKKVQTVSRKCKRYNLPFKCEQVGEGFKSITTECDDSSKEITVKYYIFDVVGDLQHRGWKVIAEVEAAPDCNIVRYLDASEGECVPEKYIFAGGVSCEHCNIHVRRRYAYILKNIYTGEFKSVGRQCLQEFTHGLDAEMIAYYMQFLQEVEQQTYLHRNSKFIPRYIPLKSYVSVVIKCIKAAGWSRSDDAYPTCQRAYNYYRVLSKDYTLTVKEIDKYSKEIENLKINIDDATVDECDNLIEWVRNVEVGPDNDYLIKLKGICNSEYICRKDIGIVASLPRAYQHYLDDLARKVESNSNYVGEIGDRIEFDADVKYLTSLDSYYGTSIMYKLTDEEENEYIWISSSAQVFKDGKYHVRGTVKDHSEYNGVKQTDLSRCKLTKL